MIYADVSQFYNSGNQSVTIQQQNNSVIQQSNNADVTNTVNSDVNTGGNTANGNTGNTTIHTGDASSDTSITNILNSNTTNSGCCTSPTPTMVNTNPSLTPTPGAQMGGGNPDSSPATSSTSISSDPSSTQVLGLSNTSGNDNYQLFFDIAGIVCLTLGNKVLRVTRLS